MERKIIVIGMDNTGKTTLVNTLKEKLNCDSHKSLGPGYTKEEMLKRVYEDLDSEEMLILERFPIVEEIVYGTILRGHSNFEFQDMLDIKKYNPFIIYCRPDIEKIFDFGEREQMEGVIEQKEELLLTFDWLICLLTRRGFDIFIYDYEYDKIDDLLLLYGGKNEHYSR